MAAKNLVLAKHGVAAGDVDSGIDRRGPATLATSSAFVQTMFKPYHKLCCSTA